jgi:hypothetical protein
MDHEPELGEIVVAVRGLKVRRGRVIEIYGSAERRRIVLEFTPELSGADVFSEPTTNVYDLDELRPVDSAA